MSDLKGLDLLALRTAYDWIEASRWPVVTILAAYLVWEIPAWPMWLRLAAWPCLAVWASLIWRLCQVVERSFDEIAHRWRRPHG